MMHSIDNLKLINDHYMFFGKKEKFTGGVKDKHNNIVYYVNGQRHRADGPAVKCDNGDQFWCLNGKLHREDGPAVEYHDGSKSWWLNGSRYGENDDFTNESWIRFVQLQLLK